MASKAGPDAEDRDEPGDTSTNSAGVSSEQPAEGPDDRPEGQEGSPEE
jgi:hypothetical protein